MKARAVRRARLLTGVAGAMLLEAAAIGAWRLGGAWLAATCHGAAVMAVALVPAPASKRWSAAVALAIVPGAGAIVAGVTLAVRGRGTAREVLRREPTGWQPWSARAVSQWASALSPCDALDGGSEEQRREALAALVERADSEAVVLLSWATAQSDPEVAMEAALALDEIEARNERGLGHGTP